ncbi:hypothetical protein BU26DRAFT_607648 [Trematosphaeria pertusa]|uniref:SnoaL-like domain-containing protein n=1 Tax=Trematosphaeria pertusa TaxID=390896 RepID=A0A6A6I5R4_9PLEO|nr:uncharacterized protein BU26DRAFT_607648 [Trematosphaeria pertusa]KAF2245388.1 hypothetical protein BU26DRAFT_607648 [Trematosphaeria pertusa]
MRHELIRFRNDAIMTATSCLREFINMSWDEQPRIYDNSTAARDPPYERDPQHGTDADVLERMKIREICEGWGTYRDTAEWENYASMFQPEAIIEISWIQCRIGDFIEKSKEGFAKQTPHGPFPYILHRINGQTIDLQRTRAVSKMKVTIESRLNIDEVEVDNEADCRFFFLWAREGYFVCEV